MGAVGVPEAELWLRGGTGGARSGASAEGEHRFTRPDAQEELRGDVAGLKGGVRELLGAPPGHARVSSRRHLARKLTGREGCHLPFPCGFWFFCCCVPPLFFFFSSFFGVFFPFPFCLASPVVCLCCESAAKVVRCRGERNPPGLITLGLIKPFASFQSNKQTSR